MKRSPHLPKKGHARARIVVEGEAEHLSQEEFNAIDEAEVDKYMESLKARRGRKNYQHRAGTLAKRVNRPNNILLLPKAAFFPGHGLHMDAHIVAFRLVEQLLDVLGLQHLHQLVG